MFESNTCLLPLVDDSTDYVLGLYGHYKRGSLLKSGGGVEDQPKYYLELMSILDWYLSDGK